MTTPKLQIAAFPDRDLLPECLPNLMPFHIDYSGPAAISTFMRIKLAKEEVGAPEKDQAGTVNDEVIAGVKELVVEDIAAETQVVPTKNEDVIMEAITTELPLEEEVSEPITGPVSEKNAEEMGAVLIEKDSRERPNGEEAAQVLTVSVDDPEGLSSEIPIPAVSTPSIDPPPSPQSITPSSSDPDSSRFVSTFRGRAIHGLKVGLPSGYVGLVLRSEGVAGSSKMAGKTQDGKDAKGKAKAKPVQKKAATRKGRLTRSVAQKPAVEELEVEAQEPHGDATLDVEDLQDALPNDVPIRTLVPTSQFSSFILWHADRPVDENRDEYFRSLAEWTKLAEEIHQFED